MPPNCSNFFGFNSPSGNINTITNNINNLEANSGELSGMNRATKAYNARGGTKLDNKAVWVISAERIRTAEDQAQLKARLKSAREYGIEGTAYQALQDIADQMKLVIYYTTGEGFISERKLK